jgi:energy-coupling factor transporter transmembrane protein EcfT
LQILLVVFARISGVRTGKLLKSLARLWPLLLFTLLIHGGSVYFAANHAALTTSILPAILVNSLTFGLRALLILSISLTVMLLHAPQRYMDELFRLRVGSGWLARKLSQVELLLGMALAFVPLLSAEIDRIHMASRSRGLATESGWFDRLRRQRRLLFPLLISAFRRADSTAIALRARGYDPALAKTFLNSQPMRLQHGIPALMTALACFLILWV